MIRTPWLFLAMLASVVLFAAAILLHERSEFDQAVQWLRDEQTTLATALADDLESRVARFEQRGTNTVELPQLASLLGGALALERPDRRILLVRRPGRRSFERANGAGARSAELEAAFERGAQSELLSRDAAVELGLPDRIALAGFSSASSARGVWGLAVVVSGKRLRSREETAQMRFLVGLGLVTTLVAGLGGMALRQQRRELEVARELEIAELEREREHLLTSANKMATLAALSSGIAHEVATPLSTIVARIEQVMPALSSDPKATLALNIAVEQVQRIQTIIQGMLSLARGQPAARHEARPDEIVEGALAFVRHRFEKAGVQFVAKIEPELPRLVCDKPMIEQALANLLLNACDASARGESVRVFASEKSQRIEFAVEDEGPGISEEIAKLATKPFVTTKADGRGTGLGLAIAHEIVANHGGKLVLERRETGRGTRAIIELPKTSFG